MDSGSDGLPPWPLTQPTYTGLPLAALPALPPEYVAPSAALMAPPEALLPVAAALEVEPAALELEDLEVLLPHAAVPAARAMAAHAAVRPRTVGRNLLSSQTPGGRFVPALVVHKLTRFCVPVKQNFVTSKRNLTNAAPSYARHAKTVARPGCNRACDQRRKRSGRSGAEASEPDRWSSTARVIMAAAPRPGIAATLLATMRILRVASGGERR